MLVEQLRKHWLFVGAFLVLGAGIGGFLLTEPLWSARLLLLTLAAIAVFLALSRGNRILWSLLGVYLSGALLLSLLLNDILPVWVVFPLLAAICALLLSWLYASSKREDALLSFGGGIIVVEFLWFLTLWPFDPKSKAAILVLFFYGLWSLSSEGRERMGIWQWLATGAVLTAVCAFVLWFAEWYA